jgi:hypothetical protein
LRWAQRLSRKNHLILAHDLALIDDQQYESLDKRTQIVQKMLFASRTSFRVTPQLTVQ